MEGSRKSVTKNKLLVVVCDSSVGTEVSELYNVGIYTKTNSPSRDLQNTTGTSQLQLGIRHYPKGL